MPDVPALLDGIRAHKRSASSQAITLVESSKREHRSAARELLTALAEDDGSGVRSKAVRVGISGVPGVGKSTFIESLGTRLTAKGHRVGVLTVDPSSIRTGGPVRAANFWTCAITCRAIRPRQSPGRRRRGATGS